MVKDYESFEENINYTRRFILLIGALMLVGKIYSEHHPNDPTVRDLNKYNFMIPKEDYFVKTDKPVKKKKFGTDFYNYTYKTVGYDKKVMARKSPIPQLRN